MARFIPPRPEAMITKAAKEAGVDPDLFSRLIMRGERSWKGWQTSPAGASGPSQLMPGTAQGLASKYHIDPQSYYGNLLGGAYYLGDMLKTFGGNARKAVAAYNAGPGNVQKYGGIPPFAETQRYVENIFAGGWKPGRPNQTDQSAATQAAAGFTPPARARPGGPAKTPSTFNTLGALQALAGGGSSIDALNMVLSSPARSKQNRPKVVGVVETPPGADNVPVVADRGTKTGGEVNGIVALAKQYLGTPYSWGGGGKSGATLGVDQGARTKGFDCSGFLQFLWWKTAGIDIGDYTGTQVKSGRAVSKEQLRPGDAVFFGSASEPHHVGMYIGNGKYIHAPKTGDVIKISNLSERSDFATARTYR